MSIKAKLNLQDSQTRVRRLWSHRMGNADYYNDAGLITARLAKSGELG
ncbi:MAG: hypothetical protein HKL80_06715 [Acidimicrobiales bacterium]|nr:hypothetical protein [Acidimicrobiales bacterium]